MKTATLLRRGLFSLAIAATLGFGATQAMAAPAAYKPARFACDDASCMALCQGGGMDAGFCLSSGECKCIHL